MISTRKQMMTISLFEGPYSVETEATRRMVEVVPEVGHCLKGLRRASVR